MFPLFCITATSKPQIQLNFRVMSSKGNEAVDLESRWWKLEEERQRREEEEIEKRWLAQVGVLQLVVRGVIQYIVREMIACPGRDPTRGYSVWGYAMYRWRNDSLPR